MTTEQGYRFVTRGIAAYFLFWVVSDLIGLPSESLAVLHHWHALQMVKAAQQDISGAAYLFRYYLLIFCQQLIRIVAMLWATEWFYRGTPGLRRFFEDVSKMHNVSEPRE